MNVTAGAIIIEERRSECPCQEARKAKEAMLPGAQDGHVS